MGRWLVWFGLFGCLWASALADELVFDHSNWQTVLDRYLHSGQTIRGVNETAFDYQGLRRNMDVEFTSYLTSLAEISALGNYSLDEQWAILINTYNAWAVNMVVTHPDKLRLGKLVWPIRSIRDISGFFKAVWNLPAGTFAGQVMTLTEIEDKIRGMGDPRIHACIVCASVSCPDLQPIAFTGPAIEAQKNHSMEQFLANTGKGLYLDEEANIMYVSSIFLWFALDFENDTCPCLNNNNPFGSVENFILTFAPLSVQTYVAINKPTPLLYFAYDWHLNALSSSHPPTSFW
jgi:hypothetical protein